MTLVVASSSSELFGFTQTDSLLAHPLGVGKSLSAVNATTLIHTLQPKRVILVGTCGAVDETLKVGDLIIAKKVIQHDLDLSRFGLKRGYSFDEHASIVGPLTCDTTFFSPLKETKHSNTIYWDKTIGCGDIFVVSETRLKDPFIQQTCDVVDMESYAVALASQTLNIPFSLMKVVSDTSKGHRSKSYPLFVQESSTTIATLIQRCLIS